MAWLDQLDLDSVRSLSRAIEQTTTAADVRRAALAELCELVPADILSWDRISLPSGAVQEHGPEPAAAEPAGTFRAIVGSAREHPLLAAHALRPRPAVRLSDAVDRTRLTRSDLYGDLLQHCGAEYGISIGVRARPQDTVVVTLGRHERQFSERDRDVLDLTRPALEKGLQAAEASERLVRALASDPPPATAVVLLDRYGEIEQSSFEAERWLAEHFGRADHPGWLPRPVASWLAQPPRPPLVSLRDGRRLTLRLLPGDPHALLLEEEVDNFRLDALERLGLTRREREVLGAARTVAESELADELFLSRHAVRERLERLEEKLGVRTAGDAVAAAMRASV